MKAILKLIKKDLILTSSFILFLILSFLFPEFIKKYPTFVNWRTIFSLGGLILITTGIRNSNYFEHLIVKFLKKFSSERKLFLSIVLLSAFLSTFLTNDITLFIVVPLTVSISHALENDIGKLLIFETIAVNVGSTLTPIGNPQNIFIYRRWDVPFDEFIFKMAPVTFLMIVLLLLLVVIFSSGRELKIKKVLKSVQIDNPLFYLSLVLLLLFIIAMEVNIEPYAFSMVLIIYLLARRDVISKSDWLLLLLFIIFFVDFGVLGNLEIIRKLMLRLNLESERIIFATSSMLSQIMSNVPAAIFMAHFTDRWLPIAYGVNVGGNGIVIASLANLITLRLSARRDLGWKFHVYSIPFFVISFILTLIFIIPIFQ